MGWRSDLLRRPSGARSRQLGKARKLARRGLVLLAITGICVAAIAQADTRWFAPFTISGSGTDAFSPQIAATPQGGSVAVWVRGNKIQAAVRSPSGSFTNTPVTDISSGGPSNTEPHVAVNPTNGDAYVVWTSSDGQNLRVQATKHPNGGSWEGPQTLSVAGQDAFNPDVAVDGNGNAFAVWARNDGSNGNTCCSRIEAATRPSGQPAFTGTETLSVEGQSAYEPKVAVDPNGNAVAAWTRSDGTNTRVQVSRRLTFTPYTAPVGASPMRISLVPSFVSCTSPNASHHSPLTASSCNPPVPTSSVLAVGPTSRGFVRNVVLPTGGCAAFDSTKCYPDFTTSVNITDVRSGTPSGADFVGKVNEQFTVRITDLFSSDGPATVTDIPFNVPATCTSTPMDPMVGSTCAVQTTANSLMPGTDRPNNRTIMEFRQIKIRDAGPNGTGYGTGCPPTCGDGDEQDFERQGVFEP